jgi:flavodoxin
VRIGIIVYSVTGHTLTVATSLQEVLSVVGHEVRLEQLEVAGWVNPGATDGPLANAPAIEEYDALVFACPVRGGTPAPPMANYLEQIPSLHGKRVACLVTGFFPTAWGRDQTLAQMAETCAAKGATVCGSASMRWPSLRRKRRIAEAVDSVSRSLQVPGHGGAAAQEPV